MPKSRECEDWSARKLISSGRTETETSTFLAT